MKTPFDDQIEELTKKIHNLSKQIQDNTAELRKMQADVNRERYEIEKKRGVWLKHQKSLCNKGGAGGYMNIIFFFEDGTRFDTRIQKSMAEFKDMVFTKGLPTNIEVRG